jgi:hypothetical protein
MIQSLDMVTSSLALMEALRLRCGTMWTISVSMVQPWGQLKLPCHCFWTLPLNVVDCAILSS